MLKKWYEKYTLYIDNIIDRIQERFAAEQPNILSKKIDLLQPTFFKNFNCNKNSTLNVNSPYANIDIYLKKLKEAIMLLKANKIIYNYWCIEELKTIASSLFFLSHDEKYIDEISYINEFKSLTLEYINLYNQVKEKEFGIEEHNARVMLHFTKCLESTIDSLLDLQLLE